MDEIAMQLRHDFRMLEHDFGYERAGLQVPAPLELEDVSLRADDRPLGKPLDQRLSLRCGWIHGVRACG
jgi:hypothetical protein